MTSFSAKDPNYEARVRGSFSRQTIMGLIGAELLSVKPGEVEIALPFRPDLCQQHGFFHAGVTSTIADSAGGYAALSLFPAEASVLTVEFKVNLLSPADGERLRAIGRVVKPGRTLTVCDVEVFAEKAGGAKLCAKLTSTLMCLQDKSDMPAAG